MLINIIHPHTLQVKGNTLVIGGSVGERTRKLESLINTAVNKGINILAHAQAEVDEIKQAILELSLMTSPLYNLINNDPRIGKVFTTSKGIPIIDEKPESFDQESWDYLISKFTRHSELVSRLGDPKMFVFIGGFLEYCVGNAMHYFHHYIKKQEQNLVYIPELCVSAHQNILEERLEEFDNLGIKPISYDCFIDLIS